ncbi:hypothetical protein Tco_1087330 [Tanacetum coccineum]
MIHAGAKLKGFSAVLTAKGRGSDKGVQEKHDSMVVDHDMVTDYVGDFVLAINNVTNNIDTLGDTIGNESAGLASSTIGVLVSATDVTKGPVFTEYTKGPVSYAKLVFGELSSKFFANLIYGFFTEKRVDYPVIENYVKNTWSKYGLVKSMMNSSNRLFFFKFSSKDEMDAMLEIGSWFIRSILLILKKYTPYANLLKKDVCNVSIWVKFHGVPITAFSEVGLSSIATELGTPLMLESNTSLMCMKS